MVSTDRDALAALYNATDGANWRTSKNWKTEAPLSQWHGVKVDDQGRVTKLQLNSNYLQGPISSELGKLTALVILELSNNQLSGNIPSELGDLRQLQVLSLSDNHLTGHIPPQLGQLGALQYLSLAGNKLDGPIPKELGALSRLEILWLQRNNLTGPIPSELGHLSALKELYLTNNELSGEVPASLGQLRNLQSLVLSDNKLTGNIPPELGDLRHLQRLGLGENHLTGNIPSELGDLRQLPVLSLNDNYLTGAIPPELGNLAALQTLNLGWNQLSGPIPKELGALSRLEELWLDGNNLTGPIPPELGDLRELRELWLYNNKLTGTVPKELANLRYMKNLSLGGTNLESPLPPMSYGIGMREWGGVPTEDDKLRARTATGVKHPGTEQPVIVKSLAFLIDLWHGIVPVVDDVTDVLLLTSTADPASALWWICLITLVVADIERLWLLFTLCLTMVLSPFLWCFALVSCSNILGRTAPRFFALMNCRNSAPQGTFRGRLADSFLWVLVGSRSRCSPLWRMVGMSLDAKVDEADHAGVAFGVIDKWVARHPFSLVGKVLFGARFALKGGNEGESRRAGVMIRAVGETLVVDSLFLALSVVSEGWDGNVTGVAGFSALFSILELLTELQYYVAEAGKVLEPVKSSGTTATAGARSEQDVVSDPSTIGVAANV